MIRKLFSSGAARPVAAGTEAIVWAYRLFLNREPESEATVERFARELRTWEDVRRAFATSEEFSNLVVRSARPSLNGKEPPMQIESVDDPSEVARLLDHIAKTWTRFGDTEPHFSVLTDERFKSANIEATRDTFNASGEDAVDRLNAALARAGADPGPHATCLELGCGVGRVTGWLARRFDRVIGTDISASHLALARAHLDAEDAQNVELRRIASVGTFDELPPFDLFFSVIVLQHNPPPVIAAILDRVFARLAPGGLAYFQVPTYRAGYSFELERYLREDLAKGDMEMHVLPQAAILRMAARYGLELLEVIEDPWTGMRPSEVSNTFLFRKAAAA
ncbi:MAG TPA: class I SAM-dependent methyltransferase [Rhodanobacteraceae bacterium]|nr:class I SAM-dependent methyltransferase [Rhodanobacteraceae bacterium]